MKMGMNLLIITLVLFSLGLVSSQAVDTCSITDRASCTGTIVMGLSDTTNAHGELASEGNYNQVLCCNLAGTGNLTCDGSNKIIGLSSTTNAHAEIPTETTYSTDICYESLTCISTSFNCADTEFPLSIFSLSDFTNAHIGGINDYGINICCTLPGICGDGIINGGEICDGLNLDGKSCSDLGGFTGGTLSCGNECTFDTTLCVVLNTFWSNNEINEISTLDVVIGFTVIDLVIENTGLPEGTVADFNIYEGDLILDDFIRTISASVDSSGKAVAKWTVTQEDMDKTNDYEHFYFEFNAVQSSDLSLMFIEEQNCNGIITCLDYSEQNLCENDIYLCQVASDSIPENVDCDDPLIDCICSWNISVSVCNPAFILTEEIGEVEVEVGTCTYASETGDNCDDGFLSYSWTASWSGAIEDKPIECVDGSRTIECPAEVQLPFFGIYNFIITVFIIATIYTILILRNKKFNFRKFIK